MRPWKSAFIFLNDGSFFLFYAYFSYCMLELIARGFGVSDFV